MAIPLAAWGVGLLLLAMGSKSTTKKQDAPPDTGPNAAPPEAAPFITRIQKCLLAMGFTGDGDLKVNGREDISTQLAIQAYWAANGGFRPLTYAQFADRLEAEIAGKPDPSLAYVLPADVIKRFTMALAKLGYPDLSSYYLAKGMFPPDATQAGLMAALAAVESAAALMGKNAAKFTR